MTDFSLAAIKVRLILSLNDTTMHKSMITTYDGVASHLLGRYASHAVMVKQMRKLAIKQDSVTL